MGKIITTYEFQPIPLRDYDWLAIREDYDLRDCVGTGKTEQDAVNDLFEKESER